MTTLANLQPEIVNQSGDRYIYGPDGKPMMLVCLYCGDMGNFAFCLGCLKAEDDDAVDRDLCKRIVAREVEITAYKLGGPDAVLALLDNE